ncbi:MAG: ATP-dependent DNA helicase RecG [Planctomycetota bacterium]|nr:ATP-dependent DNA helicase RecG [Planctomycetota bacterium]
MTTTTLASPVQYLKGVGPARAAQLDRLGLRTIRDLLYYFPRDYSDRRHIKRIIDVDPGQTVTIMGEVRSARVMRGRGGRRYFEAVIIDDSAVIYATWFNPQIVRHAIKEGVHLVLTGPIKFVKKLYITQPEYDIVEPDSDTEPDECDEPGDAGADGRRKRLPSARSGVRTPSSAPPEAVHTCGIVPIYPLTEGVYLKGLRRIIKRAVDAFADQVDDRLGPRITAKKCLLPVAQAIRNIHYPSDDLLLSGARRRFIYEELFLHQVALALRRRKMRAEKVLHRLEISDTMDARIKARFPFTLTRVQQRVIAEIRKDLVSEWPMNRLLQGDVGSGKTVVALYAMLVAVGNRAQAAIMAPTEILAEQHFQNVSRYLAGSKVRVALLVGSLGRKERDAIIAAVTSGRADMVIGTHALIEEDVRFSRLAVAVVDEQHKFGVLQRADLIRKGLAPHVLVMTATPIPRTLAMTAFGDLDVSTIDEMPPGRGKVTTVVRSTATIDRAFGFIREKIREGRQAFFVYPLIDPSDKLPLESATEMAERLRETVFPDLKIGLLHGGMRPADKDATMRDFRNGKVHVLVSTVVVEVGIDVPNATIMVIGHAERYGLAQLHQLRGRIGRGAHESYCLLFGDARSPEARSRLSIMEKTTDGFKIAEEDLRIRGPGEFMGTRQHGLPEFHAADIIRDFAVLREARDDAAKLLEEDPALAGPDHAALKSSVSALYSDRLSLGAVG